MLSNRVKTHYLDPVYHSNLRSEFRLDQTFIDSDWTLMNVGVYDAQQNNSVGLYYPTFNGVLQTFKKITITCNGATVDTLSNCQQLTTLSALSNTNRYSDDMNRQLLLNGMGFQVNSNARLQSGALSLQSEYTTNYVNLDNVQAINNQVVIPSTDEKQSGMVKLRRLLGFLRGTPILPALPDLKLVIEWNTAASDYFLDTDHNGGGITPNLTPTRPVLVYDEILDVRPEQVVSVIKYDQKLVERFDVEAVSGANTVAPKHTNMASKAFKGKFLKRLAFINVPSSDLAAAGQWMPRNNRSVAQKNEKIQLIVNSRPFFPADGISNPAMKLHYYNAAHGQLNLPMAAYMQSIRDDRNNMLDTLLTPIVGQYSVGGCRVERVIDDLRVEYQRTYGDVAYSRERFDHLIVGDVARTMTIKDGRIRLDY